ncbi:MAG TPA: D-alanyl-D-alanine carboxypeptidase [Nannocystaceae bacterium]|nr:D-alanyl-D-alanine carboxypeptidase [Nannocystaceae bacterium]
MAEGGRSIVRPRPAIFAGPGGEGTLRLRMPRARDRVRGKTGTIGGVSALSGVVASRAGDRRIAFSILMNGREDPRQSRRIQDQVVLALVDHLDR